MGKEKTLFIIKPDAVSRTIVGKIISKIELSGLDLQELQMHPLTAEQAEQLYEEHRDRSFYGNLIRYIRQGPIVCGILQGDNCVQRFRELIGDTDPQYAKEGTIRKEFGLSKEQNTIHGSDSPPSAMREIQLLFGKVREF